MPLRFGHRSSPEGAAPKHIDGRSFLKVLMETPARFRDHIFTTHSGDGKMNSYPQRSVRTNRWKYIRNLRPDAEHHTHIDLGKPVDGSEYWASWVERAKKDPRAAAIIARYLHRPEEELYDLDEYPDEQRNLADDAAFQSVRTELRAELDKWMAEQGDQGNASEQAAAEAFPNAMPSPM